MCISFTMLAIAEIFIYFFLSDCKSNSFHGFFLYILLLFFSATQATVLPGSVPVVPNNTIPNNVTIATTAVQGEQLPADPAVAGISQPAPVAEAAGAS